MDAAYMKHVTSNFAKLDKFEGVDFIRWQKKMHFLLSSMSVVYVLTTLISEDGGDDATVEQIRKRNKSLVSLINIPPSWKDFKHTLKHNKEELTLVELGSHLCIEESLKVQGNEKYLVTFIDDASRFCYVSLLHTKDEEIDKLKSVGVIYEMTAMYFTTKWFYVIDLNKSVSINSIIESRYATFNENRLSLVPRPSLRIPYGTKDIDGSVVLEEVTEEVVTQQPEPELRKGKRNRASKDFRLEF
nr:zinc finger, CCHC-type [Tanacetum cinerariifolium]